MAISHSAILACLSLVDDLQHSVLGVLVFQLKRRPPDYVPKKTKKHVDGKLVKGKERAEGSGYGSALPPEKLPYLVELSPGEKDDRCTLFQL